MTKREVQDWCDENGYVLTKEKLAPPRLTEEQIIKEGMKGLISRVARMSEITQAQMLTLKPQYEEYVRPRQLVQAIAGKYLHTLSRREIGEMTGGVHRTMVNHSTEAVKVLIASDKYYRRRYGPIIELYGLA